MVVVAPQGSPAPRSPRPPGAEPDLTDLTGPREARIVRYEPRMVEVETEADGRGCWCSWTPTPRAGRRPVTGAPAPLLTANVAFRAVAIPAGRHLVTFSYAPPAWGAALRGDAGWPLLALALWGAWLLVAGPYTAAPLESRVRVLLVADSLTPTYGWGRYAIGLVRALRAQGVDFRLLSPRRHATAPDLADLPQHGEVTSFVSETRRLPRLVAANALPIRRALADCDLVHCITEPYAVPAALVCRQEAPGGDPARDVRRAPLHPLAGAPLVRAGLPAGGPAAAGEPLHALPAPAPLPGGQDAGGAGRG